MRRYHSRSRYRDSHHTRRRRSRSSTASTSSSDSAKSHNKRHTKKQRRQTSKSRSPGHDLKSPPQKPVHTKALTTSPINVSGYTKQPASPVEEEEKQKIVEPTSRPIMIPENKMQIVSYIAPDILEKKETTDLEPVNPVQEETTQILAKTTDPESEIIKLDALMPEFVGEEDKPSPVATESPVNSNDLEQPTELIKEDPLLAAVDEKQQAPENNEPVCESAPTKISTELNPSSLQAPPPPAPHQPSPFIDSIIDSVILKSQTTSETASPLSSLNQNLNHLPINNMESSTNNNLTIFSSENISSNNQAIISDSAEKIQQQAKSKNLSKKKREFITWQPSTEQQTDENAKSTIVGCANQNDPVDGSKKVIKRPKDELKQRVKKIKSSNKPKYISEYISESQNINNSNNNIGIGQGHLFSNNENNSHTTSGSNNIINLISNTALSVLNVNRPGPEVAKKDKLQKEKIRLEKENYIRSQLWEEHCYTPHLTWLKGEDEKILTSLKSEKKEDSLIVSNLKQETSVNGQLLAAPATHEKSVKQKTRSSGISSENVCINKQPMVAEKAVAKSFPRRTRERENEILKRFLIEGIDREDMEFLRRAYELMEIPSSNQIYLF